MDGHKKQREQSARMIETALFELMEEKLSMKLRFLKLLKGRMLPEEHFIDYITEKKM